MTDSVPQISVVIVTHNSASALLSCLTALKTALAALEHELIVVDNASRDESQPALMSVFPDAITLKNEKNLGFATACNQGAASAVGEWLLFINPDVSVDHDSIKALLDAAAKRSDAGLIAGRMRFPDGSFQPTCRRFPTISNMVFSRQSVLTRIFGSRADRVVYTLPDYPEVTEVPAVAATFVMIARARFEKAGGFDRRFFMFMEDTDLSLRMHQAGFVNLFVPKAGAVHDWGKGGSAGRIRRLWLHHVSVWKYFLKNFPNGFSVLVLPALLLVNFIMAMAFTKPHDRTAR